MPWKNSRISPVPHSVYNIIVCVGVAAARRTRPIVFGNIYSKRGWGETRQRIDRVNLRQRVLYTFVRTNMWIRVSIHVHAGILLPFVFLRETHADRRIVSSTVCSHDLAPAIGGPVRKRRVKQQRNHRTPIYTCNDQIRRLRAKVLGRRHCLRAAFLNIFSINRNPFSRVCSYHLIQSPVLCMFQQHGF